MSNTEQLSMLIAAFLPFVLAMLIRQHWSNEVKATVAFLACTAAGLASCYVNHTLDLANGDAISGSILTVLVVALTLYHGFYKPSGIASRVNITMPFSIVRNTDVPPVEEVVAPEPDPTPVAPSIAPPVQPAP